MVFDFLLPWSRLNLLSLSDTDQNELVSSGIPLEVVEYFEYGKNNDGYWKGENLLNRLLKKPYLLQRHYTRDINCYFCLTTQPVTRYLLQMLFRLMK